LFSEWLFRITVPAKHLGDKEGISFELLRHSGREDIQYSLDGPSVSNCCYCVKTNREYMFRSADESIYVEEFFVHYLNNKQHSPFKPLLDCAPFPCCCFYHISSDHHIFLSLYLTPYADLLNVLYILCEHSGEASIQISRHTLATRLNQSFRQTFRQNTQDVQRLFNCSVPLYLFRANHFIISRTVYTVYHQDESPYFPQFAFHLQRTTPSSSKVEKVTESISNSAEASTQRIAAQSQTASSTQTHIRHQHGKTQESRPGSPRRR
jgi:hypothetical protein